MHVRCPIRRIIARPRPILQRCTQLVPIATEIHTRMRIVSPLPERRGELRASDDAPAERVDRPLHVRAALHAVVGDIDEDAGLGGVGGEGVAVQGGAASCGQLDADVAGLN